jgi:hypothetical protein
MGGRGHRQGCVHTCVCFLGWAPYVPGPRPAHDTGGWVIGRVVEVCVCGGWGGGGGDRGGWIPGHVPGPRPAQDTGGMFWFHPTYLFAYMFACFYSLTDNLRTLVICSRVGGLSAEGTAQSVHVAAAPAAVCLPHTQGAIEP